MPFKVCAFGSKGFPVHCQQGEYGFRIDTRSLEGFPVFGNPQVYGLISLWPKPLPLALWVSSSTNLSKVVCRPSCHVIPGGNENS